MGCASSSVDDAPEANGKDSANGQSPESPPPLNLRNAQPNKSAIKRTRSQPTRKVSFFGEQQRANLNGGDKLDDGCEAEADNSDGTPYDGSPSGNNQANCEYEAVMVSSVQQFDEPSSADQPFKSNPLETAPPAPPDDRSPPPVDPGASGATS